MVRSHLAGLAFIWGVMACFRAEATLLWSEDAENGTAAIINGTTGYPLIQSDVVARGNFAFHLANPGFQDNWFEIDKTIRVQPDTKLFFLSELRGATSSQIAKVQISSNGGATWGTSLYSQPGADFPGEGAFSLRQLDLSTYANQDVRFRFYYDFTGGFAYTQTDSAIGWFIDGIQIGNAFEKIPYSIGNPTNYEQQYLEYLNRARADAMAEATRLANETDPSVKSSYNVFGVSGANIINQFSSYINNGCMDAVAQPLAFNSKLLSAAQLHTQDQFTNQFQGHVSSAHPPAPLQPGDTLVSRANRFGYSGGLGENVYAFASSVNQGHAGLDVDWGNVSSPSAACYNPAFAGQGMQNPAGHRLNIHNDDFKEAGVGVINGRNGSVGPQLVTEDLGYAGNNAFITGVVYEDLNGNHFYDIGEGRGGVRVDVDGSPYFAISSTSGGYAIPVTQDGVYAVQFSGGGFLGLTKSVAVTNLHNVKVDDLVVAGLSGDYNQDGFVDAADFTRWRDLLGQTGTGLSADGNRDLVVNQLDYDIWRSAYGDAASGAATTLVPEPSRCWSGVGLVLWGLCCAARGKRTPLRVAPIDSRHP